MEEMIVHHWPNKVKHNLKEMKRLSYEKCTYTLKEKKIYRKSSLTAQRLRWEFERTEIFFL